MSYFRSYFEKNNTIIKNSRINTAKNPTTEIFYGSSFSKFIFKIDFTDLISKIDSGEYVITTGTTHTLHLTNTIFGDETFLGAERGSGRERTTSFDLILFKVPEYWDEGVGFDYQSSDYVAGDKTYDTKPSNWYEKTTGVDWTIEGIYSTSPNIVETIHFDNGNEDIFIDITDYVNDIISGGVDYGLGLAFPVLFQSLTSEYDQSTAFFSKYTQTFFEPYVETFFDDTINDDRYNMVTDETQSLYLFITRGTNFIDLDSNPTVDIMTGTTTGTTIIGLEDISTTKIRKGIYKVDFSVSGNLCPVKSFFYDKWKSLTLNGVSIPNITQKFILNPFVSSLTIGSNPTDTKKYAIQVYGIKQNEKILRGDNKKVVVNFRTINPSNMNFVFDDVHYRIYIKEGHTNVIVHDWTLMDKSNENFFFLNTEFYIPREYYIEFKARINSEDIFYKDEIKFEILSEVNTPKIAPYTPTIKRIMFGILGDSGEPNNISDTEAVANGIQTFNPDFVIHLGDANYGYPDDIYNNFLQFWTGYTEDKMYLSFGNHDLYDEFNPTFYGENYFDYLPLVSSLIGSDKIAGKLYCYDFVKGPVHFFVLNSGNGSDSNIESDPNAQLQEQFDEMIPKITGSTSIWKIVVVHRPPYTNELLHKPGSPQLRLDYESLGVKAVLSGHAHDYEYIYTGNTSYFVQGLGGAYKRCVVEPLLSGTQVTYCEKNGYTICYATETSLRFVSYNIDNEVIDDKTIYNY